jgi:hypothetical protein
MSCELRLALVRAVWEKKDNGSLVLRDVADIDAILASMRIAGVKSSETPTELKVLYGRVSKLRERALKDEVIKERVNKFDMSLSALSKASVWLHIDTELIPWMASVMLHAQNDTTCPSPVAWTISLLNGAIKSDTTDGSDHSLFRPWCACQTVICTVVLGLLICTTNTILSHVFFAIVCWLLGFRNRHAIFIRSQGRTMRWSRSRKSWTIRSWRRQI